MRGYLIIGLWNWVETAWFKCHMRLRIKVLLSSTSKWYTAHAKDRTCLDVGSLVATVGRCIKLGYEGNENYRFERRKWNDRMEWGKISFSYTGPITKILKVISPWNLCAKEEKTEYLWNKISLKASARFQEEVTSISASESTSTSYLIALLLTVRTGSLCSVVILSFSKITNCYQSS